MLTAACEALPWVLVLHCERHCGSLAGAGREKTAPPAFFVCSETQLGVVVLVFPKSTKLEPCRDSSMLPDLSEQGPHLHSPPRGSREDDEG